MTGRYHHGNLREALATAAVEAAREQGPDGLAVRELARRVGVSHNAAYRHFADRDALVDVVAEHALAALVDAMQRRLDTATDPDDVRRARDRLYAVGRGYVDFAVAEPGLFRVLFTAYPDVPTGGDDGDRADPYAMLNDALDDLVAVGFLAADRRPGADVTCWAAVHGFSVLCTEGPLRGLTDTDRDDMLTVMLDTMDTAYGATTHPDAVDTQVNDR